MKTVLFIPGSGEDINSRDYRSTVKAIKSKGYDVKFVSITWPRTTIEGWVRELNAEYNKYDAKDVILAGFSFGAMTAFMSAAMRNPSELWLFSLSSYFAEDLESENQKKTWINELGHRRVDAFAALNFKKLAQKISCKTLIFYGELELKKWPIMKERADGARKLIKNNSYVAVPGVGHDVADSKYIYAITEVI